MHQIETSHAEDAGNEERSPAQPWGAQVDHFHVARIPTSSLQAADSPRLSGEKIEHVHALAESGATLPPIIVHRASMRVIDGMHRLKAAMLRNERDIEVLFFDGDDKDAFVFAVKANIAHGLPLSLADRTAAVKRVVHSHPQWSDRSIAAATGVSPKTVAAIRRCPTEDYPQLDNRVGHDGRVRAVNSAEGRRIASEFIADNPNATLREIAKVAGISPTTARNVRERMRQNNSPVRPEKHDGEPVNGKPVRGEVLPCIPTKARELIWPSLQKDPSLRGTEAGRVLLRVLDANIIDLKGWTRLIDNVPTHCASMVAGLAREYAETWYYVAQEVERRGCISGATQ